MMNAINNHEEDEIRKSKKWTSKIMTGTWDGSGIWQEDGKWSGYGTWEGGGLMDGNWNVNGEWEEVGGGGIGTWEGKGKIISNLPFLPSLKKKVYIIGFILIIVASLFVMEYGTNTAIIIVIVIVLLTVLTNYYLKPTTNGELRLKGKWKDEGEFRILDLTGTWKLGYYGGLIEGKMKDPKPTPYVHEKSQIQLK